MSHKSPKTKKCGHCGLEKSLSDFYMDTTKKDHKSNICSDCQLEINKKNRNRG